MPAAENASGVICTSLYELVTHYDISVDQFFFPDKEVSKTTERRQLDSLLDGMSDNGLHIVTNSRLRLFVETWRKRLLKPKRQPDNI